MLCYVICYVMFMVRIRLCCSFSHSLEFLRDRVTVRDRNMVMAKYENRVMDGVRW